jgi:hypothetical protein
MIDLTRETLIPIRAVPGHLPRRPSGKKLHVSAVYRWLQRGVGGVRLESVKVGGTTYTSVEAIARFAQASRAATDRPGSEPHRSDPSGAWSAPSERTKRASREVDRMLYPRHGSPDHTAPGRG